MLWIKFTNTCTCSCEKKRLANSIDVKCSEIWITYSKLKLHNHDNVYACFLKSHTRSRKGYQALHQVDQQQNTNISTIVAHGGGYQTYSVQMPIIQLPTGIFRFLSLPFPATPSTAPSALPAWARRARSRSVPTSRRGITVWVNGALRMPHKMPHK